jgi:hypothetical protein
MLYHVISDLGKGVVVVVAVVVAVVVVVVVGRGGGGVGGGVGNETPAHTPQLHTVDGHRTFPDNPLF